MTPPHAHLRLLWEESTPFRAILQQSGMKVATAKGPTNRQNCLIANCLKNEGERTRSMTNPSKSEAAKAA